jgi:glycosyltransferase involved in cell wall biosynthesis
MTTVHVIVPDSVDDPRRPSGGNTYDRRIIEGLRALGWSVPVHLVAGSWPSPDASAGAALARTIAAVPDAATVLLDGLIASSMPQVLLPEAGRLREVVLVHMPLGEAGQGRQAVADRVRERAALSAAAAVVTTSRWTRTTLLRRHALDATKVHVAEPGVDPAELALGTATGGELLCVATVAPHKGHDVLLGALAEIRDLAWCCTCVGPLGHDPRFVDRLGYLVRQHQLEGRVRFTGPLSTAELRRRYAAADLLVLASRAETYGMVVTEALAAGLPVITTTAGGLPEALGADGGGRLPGLLVPPGDPAVLAAALRCWLEDDLLRECLRDVARERRDRLPDWAATTLRISGVLGVVTA